MVILDEADEMTTDAQNALRRGSDQGSCYVNQLFSLLAVETKDLSTVVHSHENLFTGYFSCPI